PESPADAPPAPRIPPETMASERSSASPQTCRGPLSGGRPSIAGRRQPWPDQPSPVLSSRSARMFKPRLRAHREKKDVLFQRLGWVGQAGEQRAGSGAQPPQVRTGAAPHAGG